MVVLTNRNNVTMSLRLDVATPTYFTSWYINSVMNAAMSNWALFYNIIIRNEQFAGTDTVSAVNHYSVLPLLLETMNWFPSQTLSWLLFEPYSDEWGAKSCDQNCCKQTVCYGCKAQYCNMKHMHCYQTTMSVHVYDMCISWCIR